MTERLLVLLPGEVRRRGDDECDGRVGYLVHARGALLEDLVDGARFATHVVVVGEHRRDETRVERGRVVVLAARDTEVGSRRRPSRHGAIVPGGCDGNRDADGLVTLREAAAPERDGLVYDAGRAAVRRSATSSSKDSKNAPATSTISLKVEAAKRTGW